MAATLQTFRNLSSKHLSSSLSTGNASLCRFLFGAPIAGTIALILTLTGIPVTMNWTLFLPLCLGMGFFQILANIFLLELFKKRNFAAAMTLNKTETIIIAVLGIFMLGERPDLLGWLGIITATAGLIFAGMGKAAESSGEENRRPLRQLCSISSLLGLGAGASLALCTLFLKKAQLQIKSDSGFYEVVLTLFFIMAMQSVISWILVPRRQRKQTGEIFKKPLYPALTGLFAVAASLCWFTAFKLQMAAYVRTLGQVEFILGLLVSLLHLKEKLSIYEGIGIACVSAGSILLFI